LPFAGFDWRPLRTNCWMVGTANLSYVLNTRSMGASFDLGLEGAIRARADLQC